MFSQASVILFTGGGGGYPSMDWGRHPTLGRHPRTDTASPPPTATAVDGTHPTGMHSCFKICEHLINRSHCINVHKSEYIEKGA